MGQEVDVWVPGEEGQGYRVIASSGSDVSMSYMTSNLVKLLSFSMALWCMLHVIEQ